MWDKGMGEIKWCGLNHGQERPTPPPQKKTLGSIWAPTPWERGLAPPAQLHSMHLGNKSSTETVWAEWHTETLSAQQMIWRRSEWCKKQAPQEDGSLKICKFELLHDGCMPPPTCQVAEYMHGCTDLYSTVVHEPKWAFLPNWILILSIL